MSDNRYDIADSLWEIIRSDLARGHPVRNGRLAPRNVIPKAATQVKAMALGLNNLKRRQTDGR